MSVINKILAGKHPEIQKIIFFDLLQCKEGLLTVSKAVNAACQTAINSDLLGAQLELRDVDSTLSTKEEVEEICNGELFHTVLARLHDEVRQKRAHAPPLLFERLELIYGACAREQDPAASQRMSERLLVCLDLLNRQLDLVQRRLIPSRAANAQLNNFIEANPQLIELDDADPVRIEARDLARTSGAAGEALRLANEAVDRQLKQFLTLENCASHFKEVIVQRGPANTRAFSALRDLQTRENMTRNQREQLQRLPRPFTIENFRAGERIALEAGLENDRYLQLAWPPLRNQMRGERPAARAPAHVIRRWIGDPANRVEVERADRLTIANSSLVFRDIRHFRGLTTLRLDSDILNNAAALRLTALPEELGELQNLQALVLDGQSFREIPPVIQRLPALRRLTIRNDQHPIRALPPWFGRLRNLEELVIEEEHFREIPQVLHELPALHTLSLRRNRHPIPTFPAWLDDKINRGFTRGLALIATNEGVTQLRRLDRLLGLKVFDPTLPWYEDLIAARNMPYAGLPRENFTEIPFRAWFMENIAIPNITFYTLAGMAAYGHRLQNIQTELQRRGWVGLISALILPLLPLAALIGIVLSGSPILLACFLISDVAFIPNAFLYCVIEPLWASIREELGYAPTVRIPLLAAPAPAAAVAVPAPA